MSTVERSLIAFTITFLATSLAHASHPLRTLQLDGHARERQFVAASHPDSRGYVFARQVLSATGITGDHRANSRVIYLDREGAVLFPGNNDSREDTSSIIDQPVIITPWEIDDDTWNETVACVAEIYSRFDVTVTDVDPGDTPHIEALFGGHPNDVGLPDNVAGVSPFTTDCGIIENSIVFTFTDVLPDDSRTMCEVMAQEIAHSYGLDHQMTPSDPMTYLDYYGDREFQDWTATCGEFESRDCGINGSVCRDGQNSVEILASRLGRRGAEDESPGDLTTTAEPEVGGCQASGSGGPPRSPWRTLGMVAVGLAYVLRRRRCSRASSAGT